MRFSTVAVALASAVVVSAADIQVTVGDGGLVCYSLDHCRRDSSLYTTARV
jgi:hypothetical protein